jgi:hypothetical protein
MQDQATLVWVVLRLNGNKTSTETSLLLWCSTGTCLRMRRSGDVGHNRNRFVRLCKLVMWSADVVSEWEYGVGHQFGLPERHRRVTM